MKGFFGVGVETISKPLNAGNLVRSTHSFGGSFFFTIDPYVDMKKLRQADTSGAAKNMPFYEWEKVGDMVLPKGCQLVGIELTDDSIPMPSFRHPRRAAYVLGPEKGSLSAEMQERCDYIVQIPMKFCINVAMAGAITLYDRMISLGRFAERPVRAGAPTESLVPHVSGGQIIRSKKGKSGK